MREKTFKYIGYIRRFVFSPAKYDVVKEWVFEISDKGLIEGTRSFLHKRSPEYKYQYHIDITNNEGLSIQQYEKQKIVLPATDSPTVSIIIPIYNQADFTYNCIRSIFENNSFMDYEIILANDNSSEDISPVTANFENLVVVNNKENLGF